MIPDDGSIALDKPGILFVALQTGAGANGGIASMSEIIRSLENYRPVILTNIASQTTRDWQSAGIDVHIVPEQAHLGVRHAPLAAIAAYIRYFIALRRIVRNGDIGLVHANDPLAFQLAVAGTKTMPHVRLLFSMRDTLDPARAVPRRKFSWLYKNADHTFFLSHDMRDRWASIVPAAGLRSSATFSVVDFNRFHPAPLSRERPKVVLVSGVISPKKGQLRFLTHVAPILAKAGIVTWLSGDCPQGSDYARKCREAARPLADKVRFLEYRSDMPELIARAHVVCISSRYEGLMRTMIEAVSMARPVVSTDVSSASEILEQPDRRAGYVMPIDFNADVARTIVRLCEDEEHNRMLGANGVMIAREKFDRARVIEAYESVYDSFAMTG